jgi:GntR family transcriptional regulator
MLISIEPDGPVPIYQQIRDRIVEGIADGRLPQGSPLPSTRQLAVDLGINFHTVNKSYDILRQEGLVRVNRKSGAVVQRDPGGGPPRAGYADEWTGRLCTLLAEAAAQGVGLEEIVGRSRTTLAGFAFPSASDSTPESAQVLAPRSDGTSTEKGSGS